MKAIALNELGEREAARSLLDFDRLIGRVHPESPVGFANIAALNDALARHIEGHPTLMAAPENYSMQQGQATGELLLGAAGPAAAFQEMVRRAVDAYRDGLPRDPGHPFLANVPTQYTATAWGVVLDAGAYQVPHIHPSAWLSGVYYVRLPENVGSHDADHAGWIEFGQPYWDFQIHAEPETRLVKPEAGLMLLFPSYMFHRTLPFEGDGNRISIAFDILREV